MENILELAFCLLPHRQGSLNVVTEMPRCSGPLAMARARPHSLQTQVQKRRRPPSSVPGIRCSAVDSRRGASRDPRQQYQRQADSRSVGHASRGETFIPETTRRLPPVFVCLLKKQVTWEGDQLDLPAPESPRLRGQSQGAALRGQGVGPEWPPLHISPYLTLSHFVYQCNSQNLFPSSVFDKHQGIQGGC